MSTDIRPPVDPDRYGALRAALATEFETQTARLTELTADTGDPGEAHTRDALLSATRRNLAQIGDALRRMADGSYGSCERCASRIPAERLEILPHATLCVPCQSRR
ncbi:TraR/DksA family transcriptional regulator [Micromonospora sp. PLK6-60]|uniref:TraR/DksA family transcriptional regulator n=1 Tax=Micromonospora sp. PLK6-60 TaxID=2873383 RepID=UPI001CA7A95B|nr:TraR/DksA family transcriptional regulator [Micromonospora sp. PLK6-60]MBY8875662.1 TraR/DksA family transcriptional regulator [Micromonospora sp. PLK6-60]